MMEGITVKLLATGVVKGGMEAKRRFVRHLRQQKYSTELQPISTAFNSTLEAELREVAEASGNDELLSIAQNWDLFAPQLDTTDVLVESEEEAVDRIASAILGMKDVELRGTGEEELEDAIVEAYRAAVQAFHERTADTELGTLLHHELGLDVARGVEESLARLAATANRLDSLVEAELKNQGFERLSREYFDQRHPRNPPELCWLSGFDLVDVRAGYAFERTRETQVDGRRIVTATLVEKLRNGESIVVLGHPGAGKSTICRQIAVRWFENRYGTVLYRPTDTPNPFTTTGTLEEYIAEADGDVLVVVENAVGTVAEKTAALVKRFGASERVTFLLEISRSEWDTAITDPGVRELKSGGFTEEDVPEIDESEVSRIVDHFETTTDRRVPLTPRELLKEISTTERIGGMYVLSYRIASHTLDPMHLGAERKFGLHTDVIDAYTFIAEMTDELSSSVGMMINLLNASGIEIYPELVHSLASDDETHRRIDEILRRLDGRLLFGLANDEYRSHHPFWSVLYLKHAFVSDDLSATHRLETCINALFALVDEGEKRNRIKRWMRSETPYFERIAADPGGVADGMVERIFKLGRNYPVLAPLFGPSEFSRVDFPERCSQTSVFDTFVWRGQMYVARGEMTDAEKEFWRLNERVTDSELSDSNVSKYYEAVSLYNLGLIGLNQRDYSIEASEYLDRSLELFGELGDSDDDPDYLKEMREYANPPEQKGPAYIISRRLEYSDAFEKAQRTLNLIEAAESEFGPEEEAKIAVVENRERARDARQRGDWKAAEGYLRESRTGFYGVHENSDRFRETILREIPSGGFLDRYRHDTFLQADSIYLNDFGELALERDRTDLQTAESYFRRSLDLSRETGFRDGEAVSLANLGKVERYRGESEKACEYFQRAAEIFIDTGSVPDALDTIRRLVDECRAVDNLEPVHEWCSTAVALASETGLEEEYREFVALREQL